MADCVTKLKYLNLGCGNRHSADPEWLHHDLLPHHENVRICFNLEQVNEADSIIYDDELEFFCLSYGPQCITFEEIHARDVLEHISPSRFVHVMNFLWKHTKPNGFLHVQVPEANSENALIDPTHYRGFHIRSFDFLDPTTSYGRRNSFIYQLKPWKVCAAQRLPNTNVNLFFKLQRLELNQVP